MSSIKAKSRKILSPYVGFRSLEISQRLREVKRQNPGRINISQIVRAAVEEKLDRIERGEEEGIRLSPRPAAGSAGHAAEFAAEATAAGRRKTEKATRAPRT